MNNGITSDRFKQQGLIELRESQEKQTTLGGSFSFRGIGIFSGVQVGFTAKPASSDHGIIFQFKNTRIPARIEYVHEVPNRTKLQKDNVSVQVVEHLLSSLRGLGVDNALIELDSDEVPILDASAQEYVKAILETGIISLDSPRMELKVNMPVSVSEGNVSVMLLPDAVSRITYFLDHEHPQIGQQSDSLELTMENYRDLIGPARTFATEAEAEYLIKSRIVGTDDRSLAIVVGENGPDKKLRHTREYVHHKMLDMIGDLSLAHWPIRGHLVGIRSGHFLNRKFARLICSLLSNE